MDSCITHATKLIQITSNFQIDQVTSKETVYKEIIEKFLSDYDDLFTDTIKEIPLRVLSQLNIDSHSIFFNFFFH